jgi:kynurenine formamidase
MVTLCPGRHPIEDRPQRRAEVSERVIDSQAGLTRDDAHHDAIPLQLAELVSEDLMCDARHGRLQIVEASLLPTEQPQNHRFPLTAHDIKRQFNRTRVLVVATARHCCALLSVTNAPLRALKASLAGAYDTKRDEVNVIMISQHIRYSTPTTAKLALLLLALSPAVACMQGPSARALTDTDARRFEHIVDLTHTLSEETPYIPVPGITFPFKKTPIATVSKNGVAAYRWEIHEHLGTQIDAPTHFFDGALSLEQLPVTSLVVPLVVIDVSTRVAANADTSLTVVDIEAWEQRHGRIPKQAGVFMTSGWAARIGNAKSFVNADASGVMHFPGFSAEAATFLARSRDVAGIGVDTLSLDPGLDTKYAAHKAWLATGKWGVELVANLSEVPPSGATVFVGATKVKGATGGPVRLIAVW